MKRSKAFTLIELLIVVVILLILTSCGGSQQAVSDPLGVLGDPESSTRSKTAAVHAVARMSREGELDAEVGRELLKRTAWGRGNRPDVRNAAIDELFAEHGIVIAFPQMDVHLDVAGKESS